MTGLHTASSSLILILIRILLHLHLHLHAQCSFGVFSCNVLPHFVACWNCYLVVVGSLFIPVYSNWYSARSRCCFCFVQMAKFVITIYFMYSIAEFVFWNGTTLENVPSFSYTVNRQSGIKQKCKRPQETKTSFDGVREIFR